MQITVFSIKPCDYDQPPDFPKMEAVVQVYDEQTDFHNSATVNVFIPKRDAPLSELKKEAIETTLNFLRSALTLHS